MSLTPLVAPSREERPSFSGFTKVRADRAPGGDAKTRLVQKMKVRERNAIRAALADRLGICLSGLCILHCALTPLALVALPSLGFVIADELVHVAFAGGIAAAGFLAFVPGYLAHRDRLVFAWAVPGFFLIVAAAAAGARLDSLGGRFAEALVTVLGSVLLIQAHRLNRRLCACCRTHDCTTENRIEN